MDTTESAISPKRTPIAPRYSNPVGSDTKLSRPENGTREWKGLEIKQYRTNTQRGSDQDELSLK